MWRRRLPAPFRSREFRILFVGQTISLTGSAIAPVALAFAVIELTGSAVDVGLVLAAGSLPQLFVLLAGGVLADRLPRHEIMVVSNLVSGLAQGAAGLLLILGAAEIWHLALLAAVRGIANAFFHPARNGITPQTIPAEHVQEANALLRFTENAVWIAGTAAGGVVVATIGPAAGLLVDGGSYLLSSIALTRMRPESVVSKAATGFKTQLQEGWSEFTAHSWLWTTVVGFTVLNAASSGAYSVLGPVVAERSLGGAAAWGAILACQSVGLVLGSLLALRIRSGRTLMVGIAAISLKAPVLVALGIPASVVVIAALALAAGIGSDIFGVMWHTTLQRRIPAERLSRVYSYDALGSWVIIPVGQAAAGPASVIIGMSGTFLAAGLLILGCTTALLLMPSIRKFRLDG